MGYFAAILYIYLRRITINWQVIVTLTFTFYSFQKSDLDKSNNKLVKLQEEFEEEKNELTARKDGEIAKVNELVSRKDEELKSATDSLEEVKTMSDKLKTEKEDLCVSKFLIFTPSLLPLVDEFYPIL